VRWDLTPDQVERFAAGPVGLVVDHPDLQLDVELAPDTAAELLGDLRDGG